jgi:hypothetical protein
MTVQHYRLVVEGELGTRYTSAFEGMTVSAHHGITEISGPVVDQSQLQGLIERIGALGLRLRSVAPVDSEGAEAASPR